MISIVLPVYNAERFLRATVQMVLAQTRSDWELIAVDDGSTDATPALLQNFASQEARIRVVTQANGGCAKARNTGMALISAETEYVIFLDHDDLWEPDALQTLLQIARARPEASAVFGQVTDLPDAQADQVFSQLKQKAALLQSVFPAASMLPSPPDTFAPGVENPWLHGVPPSVLRMQDSVNKASRPKEDITSYVPTPQATQTGTFSTRKNVSGSKIPPQVYATVTFADNALACCAGTMGQVLIRRDILDRAGPLNLECVPSDDWELYLRLCLLGPMAKTPRNVIYWRSHASNTSKNHRRMYNAEMRVRLCMLERKDLMPEQRLQIKNGFQLGKKRLAAQQCGYAAEALRQGHFGRAFLQIRYALRNFARSFQSIPTQYSSNSSRHAA